MQWNDLVPLSGEDGCRWMTEYQRCRPVTVPILSVIPILRRGDCETGARILAEAWESFGTMEVPDHSVRCVVERWYYGALAYLHYCRKEFDDADRVMVQAGGVMGEAVARRHFLLALADEAVEISFHRARIARNLRRWRVMREHIDEAWAMREGEIPYYVLPCGTSVWLRDVNEFLDSLPAPEGGGPLLPELQDPVRRRQNTDRHVRDILRIPGFVVQHS